VLEPRLQQKQDRDLFRSGRRTPAFYNKKPRWRVNAGLCHTPDGHAVPRWAGYPILARGCSVISDARTTIQELKDLVTTFARERDWDQFHSPKNLSMALAVEAAELMELFQWKTEQQSWQVTSDPDLSHRVSEELADITYFVLRAPAGQLVARARVMIARIGMLGLASPTPDSRGYHDDRASRHSELRPTESSVCRDRGLITRSAARGQGAARLGGQGVS
jgi:dCTP diphosphatase